MRRYELDMERHEYKTTEMMADSEAEAIREAESQCPGFRVVAIDDKEVVGKCEGCAEPLLADSDYSTDEDGIHVCEKCLPPPEERL